MLWVCWEQGIRSVSSYCTATAQHSVCTADRATAPLPSLWWAARHGLLIGPIGGQHVVLCAEAKFLVIWPATSLQTIICQNAGACAWERRRLPASESIDDRVSAGGVFEVKISGGQTGWLVRPEPHERHLVTVLVEDRLPTICW